MPVVTPTGAIRAWYSIGIVLLTALALMIGGILYTRDALGDADRRWCAMLNIQAADSPSPTTPRGQAAQAEAQRLAREFGCPPR